MIAVGERGRWATPGLALIVILILAAVLRLAALDRLPPAHYRDVAITACDAERAAAGHPRLHFTLDEGLFANLVGMVFRVFGASDWTLRLPGALLGILGCFGVARLGRTLGLPGAGLAGAFLLAIWPWHVILSRSGFRAVMMPTVLVFAAALLVEGIRSARPWRLAAAGALFGLGVHIYPAARFAPLFVPIYLACELGADRAAWKRAARGLVLFAVAAALVAAPMIVHYLRHPDDFMLAGRVVWVFSPRLEPQQAGALFRESLLATLLMFHVRGDPNWRHNIAGAPMIDPLSALLFPAGIVLAGLMLRRSGGAPGRRGAAALLLAWLVIMLLPTLLSVQGVPHGLRSAGALPAIALLSGIGAAGLAGALRPRLGRRGMVAATLLAALALAGWGARRTFVVWGGAQEIFEAHDGPFRAAARALLGAPAGTGRFLVANGAGTRIHGWPAEVYPYLFEMRAAPPDLLGARDAGRLALGGRPAYIALVARDDRVLEVIRSLNPGAALRELHGPGLSPQSPVFAVE